MRIRQFKNSDRIQIVILMKEFGKYLELLDSSGKTNFASGGAEYFTDKLLRNTNEKQGRVFVADNGGRVVGFVGGYVGQQSVDEEMESGKAIPGIISEFFVTQKQQRSGIGTQLLEKIEVHLKQQGCTLVRIDVFVLNQIARDFYRKKGYQDRSVIVSKDI